LPTKTLTTEHGTIAYRVERKPKNKHTYLRLKGDTVHISANAATTQHMIEALLHKNAAAIVRHTARERSYFYLGEKSGEKLSREFYKQKAKAFLPGRSWQLARITGLMPTAVKVTSAKTRWGSCSGKNSINLSCYLMKLPKEVIDYVIIHELCHIKHNHHSKRFWKEVARHEPRYKEKISSLRAYEARSL